MDIIALSAFGLLLYVAVPALVVLLLYVVVRRAVRDGIWDAQRQGPGRVHPGYDRGATPPPGR